jgi:hypothetical protein
VSAAAIVVDPDASCWNSSEIQMVQLSSDNPNAAALATITTAYTTATSATPSASRATEAGRNPTSGHRERGSTNSTHGVSTSESTMNGSP